MHLIGFDADDTLWHNETLYARVHERYRALLASHHDAATVDRALLETERRNLELYGYGIKSYTLSAIETAIGLTHGKISAAEIRELIALGQEMLAHPVELEWNALLALLRQPPPPGLQSAPAETTCNASAGSTPRWKS